MLKLDGDNARFGSSYAPGAQKLYMLCPRCSKHEFSIDLWNGPAGDQTVKLTGDIVSLYGETLSVKLWHGEQGPHKDWATLTITPSINRDGLGDPCGGWHGFITNGEATP